MLDKVVWQKLKKRLKEILAPMSGKERAEYIWEYYRYHILGVIVAFVFIGTIISGLLGGKETALNIMILGDRIDQAAMEELENDLNDYLIPENEQKKREVKIQIVAFSPSSSELSDPQIQAAALQKLTAEIMTEELDVLIIDKAHFDVMNREGGYFLGIKELAGSSELPFNEDAFNFSGSGKVTGIDVSEIHILNQSLQDPEMVLSFISNSRREKQIRHFLSYLIEHQ